MRDGIILNDERKKSALGMVLSFAIITRTIESLINDGKRTSEYCIDCLVTYLRHGTCVCKTSVYPFEVLSNEIRAKGMAIFN